MKIEISQNREDLGAKAAEDGASIIRAALSERCEANIVLATGVSQFAMLESLIHAPGIDWSKVNVFHLDEYAGMSGENPASFRRYITDRFLDKLPSPVHSFYGIRGDQNLPSECERLGDAILRHPIDLAYAGIGSNGHLAFNEPPANFETAEPFTVVNLSQTSRLQQVEQGWFGSLDDVPKQAISMTIRQIMRSKVIACIATGKHKAEMVKYVVEGAVSPDVPASILQQHNAVTIYLDRAAASKLAQSVTVEQFSAQGKK